MIRCCLLSLFFITGTLTAQPCELDRLGWLLDTWVSPASPTTWESWHRVSPYSWEGAVHQHKTGSPDTTLVESLRLVSMSNRVFFMALVDHNPLPVPFEGVSCSREEAVFVNPDHDFPKRLTYRRAGPDSLIVTVDDGLEKGFTVSYIRHNQR